MDDSSLIATGGHIGNPKELIDPMRIRLLARSRPKSLYSQAKPNPIPYVIDKDDESVPNLPIDGRVWVPLALAEPVKVVDFEFTPAPLPNFRRNYKVRNAALAVLGVSGSLVAGAFLLLQLN